MAEEKKKKKPRKQRKDKGTKRKPTYIGAFREKEGRPTMKMEVLASGGLTGAKLGNATRLSGILGSMRQTAPPQVDYTALLQQEFKKIQEQQFQEYFNKQSVAIVPKADVAQAQEEQSQQEVIQSQKEIIASNKLKEFALKSSIKNKRKEIVKLKQEKEEETRLAQEAVARADEAESELRQMTKISDEMFQEVERKKQESEALTTQMRQQKIQSIFDKANAMSLASLRTIFGNIPGEDVADYRVRYLVSQGLSSKDWNITKKGKQIIFEPKEGVYEGEAFIPNDITQLEQERAQMEDQIGGLHDTVRELMMQREDAYASNLVNESILGAISDLQTEGYERKVQEARASEVQALQTASLKQEENQGLAKQLEQERLAGQERLIGLEQYSRVLREQRDFLENSMEELRQQMHQGEITKKEFNRMKKEYEGAISQLKSQQDIEKQNQENLDLYKEALAQEMINQASMYQEEKEYRDIRIEQLTRELEMMNLKRMEQTSHLFDEERQALQAKIVEAENERDLLRQSQTQLKEKYDTQEKTYNQQLSSESDLLSVIRDATLAEEKDRLIQEKQISELNRQLKNKNDDNEFLQSEIWKWSEEVEQLKKQPSLSLQTGMAEAPIAEYKQEPQVRNDEIELRMYQGTAIDNARQSRSASRQRSEIRPRTASRPRVSEVQAQEEEEDVPYSPFPGLRGISQPRAEIKPKGRLRERKESREAEEQPKIELGASSRPSHEEVVQRQKKELQSEKEYIQRQIKRRSEYGHLTLEQLTNADVLRREFNMPKEEALNFVMTNPQKIVDEKIDRAEQRKLERKKKEKEQKQSMTSQFMSMFTPTRTVETTGRVIPPPPPQTEVQQGRIVNRITGKSIVPRTTSRVSNPIQNMASIDLQSNQMSDSRIEQRIQSLRHATEQGQEEVPEIMFQTDIGGSISL